MPGEKNVKRKALEEEASGKEISLPEKAEHPKDPEDPSPSAGSAEGTEQTPAPKKTAAERPVFYLPDDFPQCLLSKPDARHPRHTDKEMWRGWFTLDEHQDGLSRDFARPFLDEEANARWNVFDPAGQLDLGGMTQTGVDYLDRRICSFITLALPCSVPWATLDPALQAELSSWAINAKKYVEDGSFRANAIFMAWIWRLLWEHLFSPHCLDKYDHEQWRAYAEIYLRIEADGFIENVDTSFTRAYHRWRFTTTHMLETLYGEHTKRERLRSIILEKVGPYFRQLPDEFEMQHREISLNEIVNTAFKLDRIILGCSARVEMRMDFPKGAERCGATYKYDPDTMDVCFGPNRLTVQKGEPVDFIRRPSIRFFGKVDHADPKQSSQADEVFVSYHQSFDSFPLVVVVNQYPDDSSDEDEAAAHAGGEKQKRKEHGEEQGEVDSKRKK